MKLTDTIYLKIPVSLLKTENMKIMYSYLVSL